MSLPQILQLLNKAKGDGVIQDYAIAGGIATLYYTEPFFTSDLDIMVVVKEDENIIDLGPLYRYFKDYPWEGQHLVVEGTRLEFVVAGSLETEAVAKARRIVYQGIPAKVLVPEYLIAIYLKARRKKDLIKVELLLEQTKVNEAVLQGILKRFDIREN